MKLIGMLGRVGVIGGCDEYTGAPYFSAAASARLGCDMVSFMLLFLLPLTVNLLSKSSNTPRMIKQVTNVPCHPSSPTSSANPAQPK